MSEEKPVLGRDLKLIDTEFGADLFVNRSGDLDVVADEFNLGQAILHRLRTRQGELADIGHSTYGSKLYDLVGEPNNETTRERVKIVVRQTLEKEPRIKKIVNILVTPSGSRIDQVDVDVSVIATGSNVPLNIVMPFYLEAM